MNTQIVNQLSELVLHMEARRLLALLEGDVKQGKAWEFRKRGTEKALRVIRRLDYVITDPDELLELDGVGKGTVGRVKEILETGELTELQDSNLATSERIKGITELLSVINIGMATVRNLVVNHGITNIEQLREAVESGEFKPSSKIKLGLFYHGKVDTHIPRKKTRLFEVALVDVASQLDLEVRICGSYRRGREYSSDIDVLVYSPEYHDEVPDPSPLGALVEGCRAAGLLLDSMTPKSNHLKWLGFGQIPGEEAVYRIDLLFIPYRSLATAMAYYTGPYELNSIMRGIAKRMCLKLNEHYYARLDKTGHLTYIYPKSEAEVFQMVDMQYLTPRERDAYRLN